MQQRGRQAGGCTFFIALIIAVFSLIRYYGSSEKNEVTGESFSLIAYLPNLGKNGNVLILSGQEMSGTEAAGNIFTTERLLKPLLDRLPPSREGALPHFEALLRTRHLEYTSEGFDVLALHVH